MRGIMRRRHRLSPQSRQRILRGLALTLEILGAAGVLLRLTVRDRFPVLAPFYYATPWPVLAVMLGIACISWIKGGRGRHGTFALIGALVVTVFAVGTNVQLGEAAPAAGGQPVRLLFWNVAYTGWTPTRLARNVQSYKADIIALVETGADASGRVKYWQDTLGGLHLSQFKYGMALASRFLIEAEDAIDIGNRGRCRHYRLDTGNRPLHVLLVDIKGNPMRSRQAPLELLFRRSRDFASGQTIILGDFNTPSESCWFDPFREYFREAFDAAGIGYRPTWPVPLPVLQLDQIWISTRLQPIRLEHGWSIASDHRPVILEFEVE